MLLLLGCGINGNLALLNGMELNSIFQYCLHLYAFYQISSETCNMYLCIIFLNDVLTHGGFEVTPLYNETPISTFVLATLHTSVSSWPQIQHYLPPLC